MLAVFGPTATGKTSLAIDLAKKYNGVLISADSRQVYRNLDIGSGKTQPNLKVEKGKGYWVVNGIKILGFDIKDPNEAFSSWEFTVYAKHQIDEIKKEGKLPIVVGGTGFYIKTLIHGQDAKVEPNQILREKYSSSTAEHLYIVLHNLNKEKALSLNESDRKNPRRLIRAIEVEEELPTVGHKKSQNAGVDQEAIIIGLTASNSFLYKKADEWLKTRLDLGMEKEIKDLLSKGVDEKWLMSLGLEFKWITKVILGRQPRNMAVERLKGDIHALIRRQKTYFRQFPKIVLFDVTTNTWKKELFRILDKRFAHTALADIYSNSGK